MRNRKIKRKGISEIFLVICILTSVLMLGLFIMTIGNYNSEWVEITLTSMLVLTLVTGVTSIIISLTDK